MTAARAFHLGDVLSVTTGRLVSPRRMEGVLDILGWMTGMRIGLYEVPGATLQCEGPLLAQHPDLAGVAAPERFGDGSEGSADAAVVSWLAGVAAVYGETREVRCLR